MSYNEQEHNKNLLEYSDLASLAVGECYVLLPEPQVRLAKIDVPQAKLQDKNKNFIPGKDRVRKNIIISAQAEAGLGYDEDEEDDDAEPEEHKGSSQGGNSLSTAKEKPKHPKQYKKQRKQKVVGKATENADNFEYFN